jgi:predicted negative regulator of RcsB-dependent stress response
MRGVIAFLLLAILALCGYNLWQTHELRREIAQLEQKVNQPSAGSQLTDELMGRAAVALAGARDALAHTDTAKARTEIAEAERRLGDAYRTASVKAGPTVKWLREQASEVEKQIDTRVNGR